MYLGAMHIPVVALSRMLPHSAIGSSVKFAVQGRVEFAPGSSWPNWNSCGAIPGSGSPCNAYARRRFAELKAQGKTFAQISAIMTAEGSFKHYAGV